jgi:DNA-binding SARP family transcriptional activator/predicted Zn-dependent protease
MYLLRLFGGVSIERHQQVLTGRAVQRHQLALLALLAVRRGMPVSRDLVAALLWPESDDAQARHRLNVSIHVLRKELDDDAVLSLGDGLALNLEVVGADVAEFEDAVQREDHQAAIDLHSGPFLDGFYLGGALEFERWVDAERERLRQTFRNSLETLAEAAESRGDFLEAVKWWRRLAADDPCNARVTLRVMAALEAAGERSAALRHAEAHIKYLREEFDAEPEPTVTEFAEKLRTDSVPAPSAATGLDQPTGFESALEPPLETGTRDQQRRFAPHRGGIVVVMLALLLAVAWVALDNWNLFLGAPGPDDGGAAVERQPVVLADLEDQTDDPTLALAATEALRVGLSQSGRLTLASRGMVNRTLEQMRRDPAEPLDLETAREVAIRAGIGAVVHGSVVKAGSGHLISVHLFSADSGDVIASHMESVDSDHEVLPALDRLARSVRAELGESPEAIRRSRPLPEVTTTSLRALRLYAQTRRMRSDRDRLEVLREAVSLDSTFAAAHRSIATILWNYMQDRQGQVEALTRAYQHRSRLTERERFTTEASYHSIVEGDRRKTVSVYRSLLALEPDNSTAKVNLAVNLVFIGQYLEAEDILQTLIAEDCTWYSCFGNLLEAQFALGKLEAADSTLALLRERRPDMGPLPFWDARLAVARDDYDAAHRAFENVHASGLGGGGGLAYRIHGSVEARRGRLREAERRWRQAMSVWEDREAPEGYLRDALKIASLDALYWNRHAEAVRKVDEALERHPLASIKPQNRPYLELAFFYGLSGEGVRAGNMLSAFDSVWGGRVYGEEKPWFHAANGALALHEGRYEDAIAHFQEWREYDYMPFQPLPYLGLAYERAGDMDAAVAAYRLAVTMPYLLDQMGLDYWKGTVRERLAELLYERGEHEEAAVHYLALVHLWKDSDPELQARVERARDILASLGSNLDTR